MQSENALSMMTAPVILMLFAALICAVFAAQSWHKAMNLRLKNSGKSAVSPQDDELELTQVAARGMRRTTRGPRMFDPEEQERIIRDVASTERSKARAAHGKKTRAA